MTNDTVIFRMQPFGGKKSLLVQYYIIYKYIIEYWNNIHHFPANPRSQKPTVICHDCHDPMSFPDFG